ncbi:hypothetical protein FJY94_01725 [Candidatus Kaiserbacteria bacterium]|nr:hypothetical protein [Candidatus Kaiserbacteria bacterium]
MPLQLLVQQAEQLFLETSDDRDAYIRAYWAEMPDEAPDEYSRPEGEPRIVSVSQGVYDEVRAGTYGARFYR